MWLQFVRLFKAFSRQWWRP